MEKIYAKKGGEFCRKLNLNVSKNSIDHEKDATYDLITLFDAIEHLHQPHFFMKKAIKKLKKNGHILLFTPNINSFSNIGFCLFFNK